MGLDKVTLFLQEGQLRTEKLSRSVQAGWCQPQGGLPLPWRVLGRGSQGCSLSTQMGLLPQTLRTPGEAVRLWNLHACAAAVVVG